MIYVEPNKWQDLVVTPVPALRFAISRVTVCMFRAFRFP